jgi:AcrR family transcriptional regulator
VPSAAESRGNGDAAGTPTGTSRALRSRGRNTRRKLLDAGADAFATKGYHGTRVDDIVKLAATSHGTFYLYFANKEELFSALAEEVSSAMQELADSLGPLRSGAQGEAELRDWIERFADLYATSGPIIRTWTEAEIGASEFGRLGTVMLTQFTGALVVRITEAAPAGLDPTIAALAIVAMLERLNYYALTRQAPVEREAMLDTLARVTQAALFGN